MMRVVSRVVCAVSPLAVIVLGVMLLWGATDGFQALTEESARRLYVNEKRPVLPVLSLENMDGKPLLLGPGKTASDKISVVEFIYTTCPTICQTAAGDFAKIRNQIQLAGLTDRVRLMSVSFDPARDGLKELRQYAENHGATGNPWTIARMIRPDLNRLKHSFGFRAISDRWGGYQHNAAIHVIDQDGRLTNIFDISDIRGVVDAVENRL
jgi:protein SCO1